MCVHSNTFLMPAHIHMHKRSHRNTWKAFSALLHALRLSIIYGYEHTNIGYTAMIHFFQLKWQDYFYVCVLRTVCHNSCILSDVTFLHRLLQYLSTEFTALAIGF